MAMGAVESTVSSVVWLLVPYARVSRLATLLLLLLLLLVVLQHHLTDVRLSCLHVSLMHSCVPMKTTKNK